MDVAQGLWLNGRVLRRKAAGGYGITSEVRGRNQDNLAAQSRSCA